MLCWFFTSFDDALIVVYLSNPTNHGLVSVCTVCSFIKIPVPFSIVNILIIYFGFCGKNCPKLQNWHAYQIVLKPDVKKLFTFKNLLLQKNTNQYFKIK